MCCRPVSRSRWPSISATGLYERVGRGSGNSRNGAYDKTVVTEIGEVELRVPRDRNGSFEPTVVPKYQRRLDGLAGNVISLYAKGLTTGDIQQHPLEIYGTEVSRETISKITDQIVDDMIAWQSRPLDPLYAVLSIDYLVIKVRGSLTGPSMSRSASVSTASVTCSASGLALRAGRAPSSGRRC
jgi:transposase-like protein